MKTGRIRPGLFMAAGIAGVVAAAVFSVVLGSTDIPLESVVQALTNPDMASHEQLAVLELRLPRMYGDILVGAGLAASGAILQGVTRNPLADPGLLGINAGGSFALALCMAFLSNITFGVTVLFSFIGAAAAGLVVYGLLRAGGRKADPVRLVLAGSAVSILLSSLSQGIAIFFGIGHDLTFWTAGGTAAIRMEQIRICAPVMILGLVAAVWLSKKVSVLSLGEEAAAGLGVNVEKAQLQCLLTVMVLAGTAVALAGPIAFAGLLVPYFVRFLAGSDYGTVIPGSMIAGALFMLLADLLARTINAPAETPVGLIFAVLGVPLFIWIARKGGAGGA